MKLAGVLHFESVGCLRLGLGPKATPLVPPLHLYCSPFNVPSTSSISSHPIYVVLPVTISAVTVRTVCLLKLLCQACIFENEKELAQQCGALLAHLMELSRQYDKLRTETSHLTTEQLNIWNTYLHPFPRHNLNMEALQAVWMKYNTDEMLAKEELALSDWYIHSKHFAEEFVLYHCLKR